MFCKHYSTLKSSDRKKLEMFHSLDGKTYRVKYDCSGMDMTVTLKWSNEAEILVIVSVFSPFYQHKVRTKSQFVFGGEAVIALPNAFSSHENELPINRYTTGRFISRALRECKCLIIVIPCSHCFPSMTEDELKRKDVQETKLLKLSSDLKFLLESGDLSDVILSNGSIEVPCHKVVLSARSPVFSKMFKNPMKENRENRATIMDVSDEVLKVFVSFIYTGTLIIKNMELARGLYVIADQYNIQDLKAVCSEKLKKVSMDDVLEVLSLANLYDDQILKELSMKFIAEKFSQVKSQKSWNKFKEEFKDLCIELLIFVVEYRRGN